MNIVDESLSNYAECKKADTTDYVLYDSIYVEKEKP